MRSPSYWASLTATALRRTSVATRTCLDRSSILVEASAGYGFGQRSESGSSPTLTGRERADKPDIRIGRPVPHRSEVARPSVRAMARPSKLKTMRSRFVTSFAHNARVPAIVHITTTATATTFILPSGEARSRRRQVHTNRGGPSLVPRGASGAVRRDP